MKKVIVSVLLAVCSSSVYAKDPNLSWDGTGGIFLMKESNVWTHIIDEVDGEKIDTIAINLSNKNNAYVMWMGDVPIVGLEVKGVSCEEEITSLTVDNKTVTAYQAPDRILTIPTCMYAVYSDDAFSIIKKLYKDQKVTFKGNVIQVTNFKRKYNEVFVK